VFATKWPLVVELSRRLRSGAPGGYPTANIGWRRERSLERTCTASTDAFVPPGQAAHCAHRRCARARPCRSWRSRGSSPTSTHHQRACILSFVPSRCRDGTRSACPLETRLRQLPPKRFLRRAWPLGASRQREVHEARPSGLEPLQVVPFRPTQGFENCQIDRSPEPRYRKRTSTMRQVPRSCEAPGTRQPAVMQRMSRQGEGPRTRHDGGGMLVVSSVHQGGARR
jgi:hypothetical protein